MKHFSIFLLIVSTIFSFETKAGEFISYQDRPEVIDFIEMMHNKHGSDKQELKELFSKTRVSLFLM